jgi:DNA polymerase/3'-5' exonuclease PolX
MELKKAQELAEAFLVGLSPFCQRAEIAGSIRRRKPEVGDIEVVCIPRSIETEDLLGFVTLSRNLGFFTYLSNFQVLKGSPKEGKFIQLKLPEITLDLFTATPENWGLIFAIRTGSADFSHHKLAAGWVKAGYHSQGGYLCKLQGLGKTTISIKEETDLFQLIGLPWISPEKRI